MHFAKRMDARVKPGHDERGCTSRVMQEQGDAGAKIYA
jgi:hypothetical protein